MEHRCPKDPNPVGEAARKQEQRRVLEVTERHFPLSIDIEQGKDGKWYLVVHDEFAIPVAVCPFCAQVLE